MRFLRTIVVLGPLLLWGALDVHAQVWGAAVGLTSSNVQEVHASYSSSGNQARRHLSIAASYARKVGDPISAETGLRLVAKGFDISAPTFHMTYLEIPALVLLERGSSSGPFIGGGAVFGLRLQCRRFMRTVTGPHEDACGDTTTSTGTLAGLRHWDLGWEVDAGIRFPLPEGWLVPSVRVQRSLIDIQPSGSGRMLNLVATFSFAYQWRS